MINGEWSDFIADFMLLSEGVESPSLWRQWSAISAVAGALERRVWAKVGAKPPTFPNLYVLLVGSPGVGKFIIEEVRALWRETLEPGTKVPAFKVAPDSMTKASLMDTIAKAKATRLVPTGSPIVYHSLLVAAEEFGVLLPDYDQAYIHNLNSIWNNKVLHEESRRTGSVRELKIENPQLNILAGVQPSYLAHTFPEEAWASGFARRVLMIHSSEPPHNPLFWEPEDQPLQRRIVLGKLGAMSQLYGQVQWQPEAAERIGDWDAAGGPPAPTHSKLVHYSRSRTQHIIKLSIISAVARTGHLVIQQADVNRAIAWLVDAEALMPDVFREMIGRSDSQIIEELHRFVGEMWVRNKRQPITGNLIWEFLYARVPSDKIEKIVLVAEKAAIINRVAGTNDLFLPGRRPDNTGVE